MLTDAHPPADAQQEAAKAKADLESARVLGATFAAGAAPSDAMTICGVTFHGSYTSTGALMVGPGGEFFANADDLRRLAEFALGAAGVLDLASGRSNQADNHLHAEFLRQQGIAPASSAQMSLARGSQKDGLA